MFEPNPRTLSFHAVVIILLGMLAGFPYGSLIVSGGAEETIRGWRLAHMEGLLNGLLLIVIAAVWSHVRLGDTARKLLWWFLVLGGYANTVAPITAAVTGHRGLEPSGPSLNWLVFGMFQISLLLLPAGILAAVGLGKRAEGA